MGVYRNHFIKTADREIISDYEGWMNIHCRAGETLDYRRERVLQKLNTLPPFTIGFLRDRLNTILGEECYTLSVDASECILDISIITDKPEAVDMVFELIWDVVPAHMFVIISRRFYTDLEQEIEVEAGTLTMRSELYPRYNLEYLFLDNGWLLDAFYELNGYKSDEEINFYPAELEVETGIQATPGIRGHLTVENDLWYLNGEYALDGEKLLDADIFNYDL